MNTVTQYGGSYCGKSGSYSAVPGPSLLLPVDQMEPASEKIISLGCELASYVSFEVSVVRDWSECADSGDPAMNPTKVCLEPACRRFKVSRGDFRIRLWLRSVFLPNEDMNRPDRDSITGFDRICVRSPSRVFDAEFSTPAPGD